MAAADGYTLAELPVLRTIVDGLTGRKEATTAWWATNKDVPAVAALVSRWGSRTGHAAAATHIKGFCIQDGEVCFQLGDVLLWVVPVEMHAYVTLHAALDLYAARDTQVAGRAVAKGDIQMHLRKAGLWAGGRHFGAVHVTTAPDLSDLLLQLPAAKVAAGLLPAPSGVQAAVNSFIPMKHTAEMVDKFEARSSTLALVMPSSEPFRRMLQAMCEKSAESFVLREANERAGDGAVVFHLRCMRSRASDASDVGGGEDAEDGAGTHRPDEIVARYL